MPKNRLVMSELTNTYADRLVSGDQVGDLASAVGPARAQLLGDLLRLTDQVAALLVPVTPAPEFLQWLSNGLAAAAAPCEITVGRRRPKWLWLGAVLSGSVVSAAGIVLLFVLRRRRGSAAAAA